MSTRWRLADLLSCPADAFQPEATSFLSEHNLDSQRADQTTEDITDRVDIDLGSLSDHERDLVYRLWVLDEAPLGLTLAGPVYQDNPIIYANRTFRELTGYSMSALQGENLRVLQGPDTEPGPVDTLREALDIWERATVELWNYRADGTRFRNRVSLVPLSSETGMITNWIGIQERVEE